jgi:hypothetical protein
MHAPFMGERLAPTERRVAALRPPPRVVRAAARSADVVDLLNRFVRRLLNAVDVLHLVRAPGGATLDPDAAGEVLELIDLHTTWDTWDRLRTWQSLSAERSCQLVIDLVTQALER